ncbi:MAG: Stk1 family PASTA domain-containing Ser/Thr kinase [Oscillospiraceae bacterium]
MDKFIGKKIDGRYEICELIGVGGMANVYKANDTVADRVVAVKILRDEYAQNEEFLRRFKNESKAISVLSHPNIVKIYDVSFSDKFNSIVMEYIDGITLKEYIEYHGSLRYREAVHFTVQILRALQHAHDKGIVHRDIKPHNIMLLRDATIKITDFGIARFARSESKTLTDRALGSVHYISPEQASGDFTDARTDIYSVGVMLFEMLTGALPFEADTPVSVAIKQIQAQPRRPREINPEIPEALEEIIIKAMQKNPKNRYQSANEMLQDIAAFKSNPSISFAYKYLTQPVSVDEAEDAVEAERKRAGMNNKKGKKQNISRNGAKSVPVLPVLAGISFAFALVAVLFIVMLFIINDPLAQVPDISCPNLVGKEYEEIIHDKSYRDEIVIEVAENQFNGEYPAGVVFKQEPIAGKTIKEGATIKVTVSAGVQTVILPDYSGQDATEVYKKLREQGLDYDEFLIFSDTIAEGYVVRTDPDKKSEVNSGELVTVYVSRGPQDKSTRVPNVTGMKFDEAKTMLGTYKLRVSNVQEIEADDEDVEPGTVLDQKPPADTEVAEGTSVELRIVEGYLNMAGDQSETSEKGTVRVEFEMPTNIKKTVTVQAREKDKVITQSKLIPSEAKTWAVNFKGSGTTVIDLYIDDKLYGEYNLNFKRGTYTKQD